MRTQSDGAQALPELHLEVHVYATKAAERFVYRPNMRNIQRRRHSAGGSLCRRIRRYGVVLS